MNKNSQAILIFCCTLCTGKDIVPLKPSEWRKIARILLAHQLTPSNLLDFDVTDLREHLSLDEVTSERLFKLIGRSGSLFFEIAQLEKQGIHLVTRADTSYPPQIKTKLGDSCPPYFFYAGDIKLTKKTCIGFVGSRHLTTDDIDFETPLVKKAISSGFGVVSGGAGGADSVAEQVALNENGYMVEYLSGNMLQKMKLSKIIRALQTGRLLLLSHAKPNAGFNAGNAMGRNRFIYAHSKVSIAIKSEGKGGTWNGVVECLKNNYAPVYCWNNPKYPENLELISMGALPLEPNWTPEIFKTQIPSPTPRNQMQQLVLL